MARIKFHPILKIRIIRMVYPEEIKTEALLVTARAGIPPESVGIKKKALAPVR